jgi:undecaprenyl-diphosphatase
LVYHDPLEGSFPSGHALFYFALSYVIYAYNKKLGTAFYIFSLLIVFSRVYVGIHWPADILAGAIIGTLVAWGTVKLAKKYFKY